MTDETELEAYLVKNAERLVRALAKMPDDKKLDVFGKHIRRERFGNPYSRFLRGDLSFRLGGEDSTSTAQTVQFYLQHFNGVNSAPEPLAEEPVDLKYFVYDVFKNSGFTPIPHRFIEFPDAILLTSLGDMMLEEKLAGLPLKERDRLNKVSGELLLDFHHYGQKVLSQIVANAKILEAIRFRAERPQMPKGLRTLNAFFLRYHKRIPDEAEEKEFITSYAPVCDICDNSNFKTNLIHGDFGAQNILGKKAVEIWMPENMGVIDLTNLQFGNPVMEQARLGVSNNMLLSPAEWNSSMANYMRKRAAKTYDIVEYKESWFGKLGKLPLQPDVEKESYTLLYTGIINYPWAPFEGYIDALYNEGEKQRNSSDFKAQTKYDMLAFERPAIGFTKEQAGRNSGQGLDYVLSNPGQFLWNQEQLRNLERLKKFWKDIGYIPEKDITRELESRIKTAYEAREAKTKANTPEQ